MPYCPLNRRWANLLNSIFFRELTIWENAMPVLTDWIPVVVQYFPVHCMLLWPYVHGLAVYANYLADSYRPTWLGNRNYYFTIITADCTCTCLLLASPRTSPEPLLSPACVQPLNWSSPQELPWNLSECHLTNWNTKTSSKTTTAWIYANREM